MLIIFSEIPMFAILTKMDKCTLSKNEEEEMKIQICKSINIAADKLLLDISLLKFLAKVHIYQLVKVKTHNIQI